MGETGYKLISTERRYCLRFDSDNFPATNSKGKVIINEVSMEVKAEPESMRLTGARQGDATTPNRPYQPASSNT